MAGIELDTDKIVAMREDKGWTQADAAAAMGFSRQRWHTIESGKWSAKLSTLNRIAKVLGCNTMDLLMASPTRPRRKPQR